MKDHVASFILENNLLRADGHVLAGVSGGADSVCLLLLLNEIVKDYGKKLFAVHVNHEIRGEDADKDEKFVKDICERLGVEFYAVKRDVSALAKERGETLEECGRNVRYETFYELAQKLSCRYVAVAHHKDDAIETILLNILRGCGPDGLAGLKPSRILSSPALKVGNNSEEKERQLEGSDIFLIRPLLCVTKNEIAAWMRAAGENWREDSTNRKANATRNRVRLEVLPLLEKIRPGVSDRLLRLSALTGELDEYAWREAGKIYKAALVTENGTNAASREISLSLAALKAADPALLPYVLKKALKTARGDAKDIEEVHLRMAERLIFRETDASVDLPSAKAVRRGDLIKISADAPEIYKDAAKTVRKRNDAETAKAGATLKNSIVFALKDINPGGYYPENLYTKWFDYDKISHAVAVRHRRQGDYLTINGGERKLLRRWFIDEKIPREERDKMILVADGSHIMWIVGGRMSDYYKIDRDTRRILEAKAVKDIRG